MNPALKLYLDKLHAETRAQYAEIHKQLQLQEALFSKFDTGVSTPQSAGSAVVTSDGGHTVDATVMAVVPDTSSSTTKAEEVLHGASLDSIDPMPMTCSTDGSNQVVATASVDEVHDAATAVRLEPAVDLIHQEVEQLTPAQATAPIGTSTPTTAEVVPPMATTTDVDPKAGVQESDALSVNTTPVTSEVDQGVVLIVSSDPATPMLTSYSTECSRRDTSLLRYMLHPAATPSWLVLRPRPWPSCWRDQADGNATRPMPWPSLACSHILHLEHAGLLSQITSMMKHFSGDLNFLRKSLRYLPSVQPHEIHSSGLVLLLFRIDDSLRVCCCELISMEQPFSCFPAITCVDNPGTSEFIGHQLLVVHEHLVDGFKGTGRVEFKKILVVCVPTQSAIGSTESEFLNLDTWPGCLVSFPAAILVSCAESMMLHLNRQPSLAYLEMVNSSISLCKFTVHINHSVQRWIFDISAGFSMVELERISSHGTFATHAGCLISWDCSNMELMVTAASQQEQRHYHGRQPDAHYILQLRGSAEHFFEFYSRKFLLMGNLQKHNSETSVSCTSASVVHNSNEFTCTCCICLGIPLVDSRIPLMKLELLITQPGEHLSLLQPKPPWSILAPPPGLFTVIESWQYMSDDPLSLFWPPNNQEDLSMTELKRIFCSGIFTTQACCLTDLAFSTIRLMEYQKVCLYWRIWDPGWRFCCIIILGTGDVCWDLHQMILSNLKNSAKTIEAELAHGYKYSATIDILSCLSSEPISCEAGRSGWDLALLKLLAVHTIQIAMQSCDSKSGPFASAVLLFGHTKSMNQDLNLLSPASAMSTLQVLFYMKTTTESVTILKISSRMFQDWIAPLLGSKSASSYHFEQFWDPGPGNNNLLVRISHPLEDITHCRGMLSGGQNLVHAMEFSSGCEQAPFQAGCAPRCLPTSKLQPSKILILLLHWPCFSSAQPGNGKLCANIWHSENMLSKPQSVRVINIAEVVDSAVQCIAFWVYHLGNPYGKSFLMGVQLCHFLLLLLCACPSYSSQQDVILLYVTHSFYLASACVQVAPQEERNVRDHTASLDQLPHGSDYYLSHDRFSELVQVHLNHGYYHDNYHGDPSMFKDLQAPWDPGEFFMTAAWGQAAFQEGRDVRDLLGSPWTVRGPSPVVHYLGCRLQVPGEQVTSKASKWDQARHGTDGSFFSHLRLSPLIPFLAAIEPQASYLKLCKFVV